MLLFSVMFKGLLKQCPVATGSSLAVSIYRTNLHGDSVSYPCARCSLVLLQHSMCLLTPWRIQGARLGSLDVVPVNIEVAQGGPSHQLVLLSRLFNFLPSTRYRCMLKWCRLAIPLASLVYVFNMHRYLPRVKRCPRTKSEHLPEGGLRQESVHLPETVLGQKVDTCKKNCPSTKNSTLAKKCPTMKSEHLPESVLGQ